MTIVCIWLLVSLPEVGIVSKITQLFDNHLAAFLDKMDNDCTDNDEAIFITHVYCTALPIAIGQFIASHCHCHCHCHCHVRSPYPRSFTAILSAWEPMPGDRKLKFAKCFSSSLSTSTSSYIVFCHLCQVFVYIFGDVQSRVGARLGWNCVCMKFSYWSFSHVSWGSLPWDLFATGATSHNYLLTKQGQFVSEHILYLHFHICVCIFGIVSRHFSQCWSCAVVSA